MAVRAAMAGLLGLGLLAPIGSAATPAATATAPATASAVAAGSADGIELALFGKLLGGGKGGACEAPGGSGDADVRRNAAAIESAGLCVTSESLSENGLQWNFTIVTNPAAPRGPDWYLPHDNENTAFDSAVYAVARYGGRLLAVDGPEARNYQGIDPNRWFADSASEAAPCDMSRASPKYTRHVMGFFKGARYVLSMHNNTAGGTVSADMNSAKAKGYRAGGPYDDRNHMVFIAGREPLERDRDARGWRDRLNAAGLNVVHETVSRQNSDCSFSNYVALNDRRAYFNIEAVHGSRIQTGMVDKLMAVLGYRPVR